ncbi:MAG TPA: phage tail protein [Candidatus Dormibacteraeota bacterium]|nr:phage tail protein [Candidatus Dormibacteraeota bacterium]
MSDGKLDRRGFLAGAAGLTGVALSVGAWKPVFAMETGPREALNGHIQIKIGQIVLKLGESTTGLLFEAEGGSAFTDVIESAPAGSGGVTTKKIPGNLKWSNVTLKHGITSMDKTYFDWVAGAIAGKPVAMSGSIAGATEDLTIVTQTNFFNALITEVGFPALDAASKDAAKMTIKFQPESTRPGPAGGKVSSFILHRGWPSKVSIGSFKLTINGMDTSFVTKIDPVNIKLNYTSSEGSLENLPRLASVDAPNMKITVLEGQAKDFFAWHQDFVINGNNGPENEKTGSLSFLSGDFKTELFRLDLSGLGIFDLEPDPLTLTNEVRHVTAQLYCDKMIFNFKL